MRGGPIDIQDTLADNDPAHSVEDADLVDLVRRRVKLTDKQTQVLSLLHDEGHNQQEIARMMIISQSAVSQHLTAILKKVQKAAQEYL